MTRILVVDDSVVYRSAIKSALHGHFGLEVVGTAANGRVALELLHQSRSDVVTLDVEMPELDGIETLKLIRAQHPKVRVLMLAGRNPENARKTLVALSLGADDFVEKPESNSPDDATVQLRRLLIPHIQALQEKKLSAAAAAPPPEKTASGLRKWTQKEIAALNPPAILVASSTGGPISLETMLLELKAPLQKPILVVQHMPPLFTQMLAERLHKVTHLPCFEAANGTRLENAIYVAPGDHHMRIEMQGGIPHISLNQDPPENSVRPAADVLFRSAVAAWNEPLVACILTGMGHDGLEGCRAVKAAQGAVVIQNESSSVVWGMPGAVAAHGLSDCEAAPQAMGALLSKICNRG